MGKGLKGTLWYLLGCPVGTTQLTWNYASHPIFLGKDCQGREEEIKTKKVKGKEEVGKRQDAMRLSGKESGRENEMSPTSPCWSARYPTTNLEIDSIYIFFIQK